MECKSPWKNMQTHLLGKTSFHSAHPPILFATSDPENKALVATWRLSVEDVVETGEAGEVTRAHEGARALVLQSDGDITTFGEHTQPPITRLLRARVQAEPDRITSLYNVGVNCDAKAAGVLGIHFHQKVAERQCDKITFKLLAADEAQVGAVDAEH